MNHKLILGVLIIGLFLVVLFVCYFNTKSNKKIDDLSYQGPIRPTDDVEHFRETGETIPLEVIE